MAPMFSKLPCNEHVSEATEPVSEESTRVAKRVPTTFTLALLDEPPSSEYISEQPLALTMVTCRVNVFNVRLIDIKNFTCHVDFYFEASWAEDSRVSYSAAEAASAVRGNPAPPWWPRFELCGIWLVALRCLRGSGEAPFEDRLQAVLGCQPENMAAASRTE